MRRLAWLIWIALVASALPGRALAQTAPLGTDYNRLLDALADQLQQEQAAVKGKAAEKGEAVERRLDEAQRQAQAERQRREALEREVERLRRAAQPAAEPPPQASDAERRRQADEARRREIERRHEAEYDAWQAEVRAAQERIREEALRREAEEKGQRPPRPGTSGAAAPAPDGPAAARRRPTPLGTTAGLALAARRPEEVCAAGSVLGPSAGAWKDDSTGRGSYLCFTPYVELPRGARSPAASNIAFYARGRQPDYVDQLSLVLNVRDPTTRRGAKRKLVAAATALFERLNLEMPDGLAEAVESETPRAFQAPYGGVQFAVERGRPDVLYIYIRSAPRT
jgi:hypothetical protein